MDRIICIFHGNEYANDNQKLASFESYRRFSIGAHVGHFNLRSAHDRSSTISRSFGRSFFKKKIDNFQSDRKLSLIHL